VEAYAKMLECRSTAKVKSKNVLKLRCKIEEILKTIAVALEETKKNIDSNGPAQVDKTK
jgi:hypothetical protein